MYIQFQPTDPGAKGAGCYQNSVHAYLDNKEAKENFFNSLSDGIDFFADHEKQIKLNVTTVNKIENSKEGGYMEFKAMANWAGYLNMEVKGIVTFNK
jgi:hypothetical protein